MRPSSSRSLVLETLVDLVFHAILATSLYFLFAGHNGPGGGFIGGLVAGTALVLRYLVSAEGLRRDVRLRPATVLGTGLLVAGLATTAPWLLGRSLLESGITYLELPVLGEVPLASVLVFDTGVYLVVVGIVLAVLSTLGAREHSSLGGTAPPGGDVERVVR